MKQKFSNWVAWENRKDLIDVHFPGVYCLAVSSVDLANNSFEWIPNIAYIGMSNAKGGIKSRLKQFDNTIMGKSGHGGADRFKFKFLNYNELIEKLYVSISPFDCNVNSFSPQDLRMMGKVASFEYECIAEYIEFFGRLPEFNDRSRSPKYSLNKI